MSPEEIVAALDQMERALEWLNLGVVSDEVYQQQFDELAEKIGVALGAEVFLELYETEQRQEKLDELRRAQ